LELKDALRNQTLILWK